MKLPSWPKLQLPRRPGTPAPKKMLQASARRAMPVEEYDDEEEEPTMRLSSAFIVVLLLHVVAVGGIWAFNSLKTQRKSQETLASLERKEGPASKIALPESEISEVNHAPVTAPAIAPAQVSTPVQSQSAPAPVVGRVHRVKDGENLTRIAAAYGTTVEQLMQLNNLKEGAHLQAGQRLQVPDAPTRTALAPRREVPAAREDAAPVTKSKSLAASGKTYTVMKGDNPVAIARKLNVSYAELLKLNHIDDPRKMQIGAVLQVPASK